jgi:signal peptidase
MSKLFSRIIFVVIPLLLLCAVTLVVLNGTGNLPNKYNAYLVHTGSMEKTIPTGSIVFVEEHKYHVGQVITFRVNGMIVTHRLMAISPNGTITTKGDSNPTADPWHPPVSNIIGGVVLALPFIGRVQYYFLSTWEGGTSAVIFIFMMLIIWKEFLEDPKTVETVQDSPLVLT